jgi:hypothetical protein
LRPSALSSLYALMVIRRLLTLLLCACLALQGTGMATASDAPCPMEADMEAMVLAGDLDITGLPDCCNDMQTWVETGHLCKPGLDCAGLVVWAPAPSTGTVAAASASDRVARPSPMAVSAPPGVPWRPPTGA